jgi:hypothetical protein
MNYNLQGARSQARLDWDALEARNSRAQSLPRRIFALAVIVFAAYLAWGYFIG